MTTEEVKRRAELYSALAEGKTIQVKNMDGEWTDVKPEELNYIPEELAFRIKPETKYRPFRTQEECWNEMLKHQPFGWIKHKTRREYAHIDGLIRVGHADFVRCLTIERYDHEFYNMFKNYTFLDSTPFGVKEE